jgi:hypothetical protein
VAARSPLPPPAFVALSAGLHLAAAAGAMSVRGVPPPSFQADAQTLSGDTLDVEPPPEPAEGPETVAPEPPSTAASRSVRSTPVHPREVALPPSARLPVGAGASSATGPEATFGAVGVRYATDLATTFTRAFPQAASADAVWTTAPFGKAGAAEVAIAIDQDGRISATAIAGSPSPALRRGIERTLAVLEPRAFTSGTSSIRLRVAARVAPDEVHDGLHGDVFALSGGSFSGDLGTAFFALPGLAGPGRRVDVEIRLLP